VPLRIVCGVDDSRGGREALISAAALSQRLGAQLVVVNVASRERAVAETLLDHLVESGGRAADADRRVELGRPAARLAALAAEEGAELLVVGSRGRGRLGSAVLGSVSRELVALATCPVLVVPPGSTGIRREAGSNGSGASIVCGVDGSPESRLASRKAADLARRLGDQLVVTHVYRRRRGRPAIALTERENAQTRLDTAAAALPPAVTADLRLRRGHPASEVCRVAEEERAEMIVVGSRARGSVPGLFSGSLAGDLAASGPAPVLIVTDGGWREVAAAA